MFCPKCRSEYRDGFTRCAGCDCDLVEEEDLLSPLEAEEEGDDGCFAGERRPGYLDESCLDGGVMVFETSDPVLATTIENLLDENEIAFAVRNMGREGADCSAIFGCMNRSDSEPAQFFVHPEDEEDAKEVLEDFQAMTPDDNRVFSELPPELAEATDEPDSEDDEAMFCPHCGEQLNYARTDLLDRRLPCPECGKIIE